MGGRNLSKDLVSTELVLAHLHLSALVPLLPIDLAALSRPVLLSHGLFEGSSGGGGGDKLGVVEQGGSAERAFEETDRSEDESGADLDERVLGRAVGLQRVFLDDLRSVGSTGVGTKGEGVKTRSGGIAHLEVSEPDLVVEDGEEEDMVDEGFQPSRGFRDTKHLGR